MALSESRNLHRREVLGNYITLRHREKGQRLRLTNGSRQAPSEKTHPRHATTNLAEITSSGKKPLFPHDYGLGNGLQDLRRYLRELLEDLGEPVTSQGYTGHTGERSEGEETAHVAHESQPSQELALAVRFQNRAAVLLLSGDPGLPRDDVKCHSVAVVLPEEEIPGSEILARAEVGNQLEGLKG